MSDAFRGWTRPGPEPPGGLAPEPGETLDFLCGRFRIFQYEDGHRYSTDDLLVAWWGTTIAPRAARCLDLGSGIGSVALAVAWRLPGAVLVTLEAQEISVRLAKKSARYDGVEGRVTVLHGDLRDGAALAGHGAFDLVLGAPPYFPPGSVTETAHPQAGSARVEKRGDVADYARAAASRLAPGGVFAFVMPAADARRVEAGLREAGLVAVRRRDVEFREGEGARLTLWGAWRRADLPALPEGDFPARDAPLVVRRRDGRHAPEYAAVRLAMGFPPGDL